MLEAFPIIKRQDEAPFGRYRPRDMILAYMTALNVGDIENLVSA